MESDERLGKHAVSTRGSGDRCSSHLEAGPNPELVSVTAAAKPLWECSGFAGRRKLTRFSADLRLSQCLKLEETRVPNGDLLPLSERVSSETFATWAIPTGLGERRESDC